METLGEFIHNQTRESFQGFKYDKMNEIGSERGGRMRDFEGV